MMFLLYAAATCLAVTNAMVCYHGICNHIKQELLSCPGSVIEGGGFCGCTDVCAKMEGEICQAELRHGMIPQGTCNPGLTCQAQRHMLLGLGKCVKNDIVVSAQARGSHQSLCQRKRTQSMIVMIVYRGQWFPRCDGNGLFQPQQCDNTGMCFCVDVNSGDVDAATKVHGPANCGATPVDTSTPSLTPTTA